MAGAELKHIKRKIRADIAHMLAEGIPINGEVLPENYKFIDVVGKGTNNLQVRIIYNDRAPYYFDVIPE